MFSINNALNRRSFLGWRCGARSTRSALAGCSSGGSDGGSADDGKTFKIGVIGPLTGAAATYGVSAEKGAKLAAKDFSTKDLKLSLKSEDDVADGERLSTPSIPCATGACRRSSALLPLVPPSPSRGEIADDMLMVTPSASSRRHQGQDHGFPGLLHRSHHGRQRRKVLGREVRGCQDRPCSTTPAIRTARALPTLCRAGQGSKLDIVDTETLGRFFHELYQPAHQGQGGRRHAHLCADLHTPASVLLKNAKDMGYD